MRTLLIGAGGCLTIAAFFAAERLHSTTAESYASTQEAALQAALDDEVAQARASFAAETAALENARNVAQDRASTLTAAIENLTAERDSLGAQLATLQSDAETAAQQLASLAAINSGMVQKVEFQQASIAERDSQLVALRTRIDNLGAAADVAGEPGPDTTELLDEIASLSDMLVARDETIASLQDKIATADDAGADAGSLPPELEADLAAARAEIASLTEKATEQAESAEARIAELTGVIEERDAAVALLEVQLANLPVWTEPSDTENAPSEDVATLSAQLAELTERVSAQSEVISNLRMGFDHENVSGAEMAEACIARANKIFEISQIKFATGTASISQDSGMTLDHLRDLAIGCESDDMFIEIGGHTDSYGSESENQQLSEARAESVRNFLIARGIPAETMVAVGFGEAHPVATNETAEGRAQNRRISFSWQMREDDAGNVDG